MKQILRVLSSILLAVPLIASCDKKQDEPINSTENKKSGVTIEMEADLEDLSRLAIISAENGKPLSESESRVFFEDNGVGRGISFGYREGEELNTVFFFKRGRYTAQWETKLIVREKENARGQYEVSRTTIEIPYNISQATGPLEISAAIGVLPKRGSNNTVTVPSPDELIKKKNNYSIPMYFPRITVDLERQKLFSTRFKVYGALVGFTAINDHNTKFTLKELDLKTAAFDTEGEMNLDTEGYPTWIDTQRDNITKTIRVIKKKGENVIPANGEQTFFFWVKPTATSVSVANNMEIGLKSFSSYNKPAGFDVGLAERRFNVPVAKPLQEGLVHRISNLELPLTGGLIITEVFRGANSGTVAVEVYNSSDEPINLADYKIASYNPKDNSYKISPLIKADYYHFKVLIDNKKNEWHLYSTSSPEVTFSDMHNGHYTLEPKQLAVYVATSIIVDPGQVRTRPNVQFVFNMYADKNPGFMLHKGGYIELLDENDDVLDVFLKMKGSKVDQGHNVWSYTMMRKPDRNTPRQTMAQGSNSDWVSRDRTESIDWGYRFGYQFDVTRTDPRSAQNGWMDGPSKQFNGMLEIAGNGRPLTYLNTDPNHAGFLRSWQTADYNHWRVYTVPTWWTKKNGAH